MFKYKGSSFLIKDCVDLANELVQNNKDFHEKIRDCYFDMATCNGEVIDDDINKRSTSFKLYVNNYKTGEVGTREYKEYPLIVKTYKSKNPWSSAYGYFSPSQPDHIFLNIRKLNRSKGSIVSSLIHEMVHYTDHLNKQESYGHGDNKPVGKENTAPYYIDNIAEGLIDNKLPDFNNIDNNKIKVYTPFWRRLFNFIFRK